MEKRAFVLLSGGVDSTTLLYLAKTQFDHVEAVSINYGQRHKKEIKFAAKTADKMRVPHTILALPNIMQGVMLTDQEAAVPNVTYDQIDGISPTYVPFRNGTFLAMLSAHAQKWWCMEDTAEERTREAAIYFGAHAEDAANWAYPDCTPEFIGAMANAIFIGTYQQVRLHTPLMWLSKTEIVRMGYALGVQFEDTWSCYKGDDVHCGRCPTCYARAEAFKRAGVADPTVYLQDPHEGIAALKAEAESAVKTGHI